MIYQQHLMTFLMEIIKLKETKMEAITSAIILAKTIIILAECMIIVR